ncbi:unnamed protein product [Somion occarium]|uniref:Protein kinase domain-containing protein n=1 Tax=Somion occarium TaxID=3059160 RepID=A0ABP1CRV7_9APHY
MSVRLLPSYSAASSHIPEMGLPSESKPSVHSVPIINLSKLWIQSVEKNKVLEVWSTLSPWFAAHGYALYTQTSAWEAQPSGSPIYALSSRPVQFPYAFIDSKEPKDRAFWPMIGLFPAVNSHQRDVIIKLLYNDSPEFAIFKSLAAEPMRSDPLNTTIPALEILSYDDEISFIVMPRWGDISLWDGFDRLETAVEFALSLIKALAFLHKNLIAHRDIKLDNILVNKYHSSEISPSLRSFFASKKARFALCDFGLSVKFSPETPPCARVCPASESEWGYFEFHPPDAANGESVYDPFAYDVACLGGLLCKTIGYMTPLIPPLAPFLDRMITPDISARYTASEALEAFVQLMESLDSEFLGKTRAPSPPEGSTYIWQAYDRWANLPEEFVREHFAKCPPVRPRRKVQLLDGTSYFVDWNNLTEF